MPPARSTSAERTARPSRELETRAKWPRMRTRGARTALLVGLLASASSCKKTLSVTLEDTESRKFELRCEGSECKVSRLAAPPVAPAKVEVRIVSVGRIMGICDVAPGDENPPPFDCRPIVCSTNEQCPRAVGLEYGVCVNEHCIEPSHDITVEDSIMLCLAGTGVGRDTPKQAELYVMAYNCGSPCRVPRVCSQP